MPTPSPAAILFVDDDPTTRNSTSEVLRRAGFDVWEAPAGREALRLARQHPDLVLLDVRLPDMDGFEVCRRLRADPATAPIPILHLSGVASSSEDLAHGLEGGADGYLIKPVDPAVLVAHVRALLRLSHAEESLRESEERYRLIAENASAPVFMIDEQSTILFANRAAEETFGYPAAELLGDKLTRLMPDSLRGRHEAGMAHYLSNGRRSVRWEGMEIVGRHRSGREIVLELSFGEFRDRLKRRRFVGVARDITARKEAEQALAHLSRRLLEAQEAERRHIAHELHDEVGQALTALKITLHDAAGQVDRMMQQVRTLSLELRPPMLDDLGLVPALSWHVKGVTERTGLPVRLEADPVGRLPAELEMACFRLVQEALNNVVKHARATGASVELRKQEDGLHLTVRDNGVGFDAAAARQRARHGSSMGLLRMEERCLLLGGEFGIESAPGQGTEIRARIPLGPAISAAGPDEGKP